MRVVKYVIFETYQCAPAVKLSVGVLLQKADIVEVIACFTFNEVPKCRHPLKYVFSGTLSLFPARPHCCVNYLLTIDRVYYIKYNGELFLCTYVISLNRDRKKCFFVVLKGVVLVRVDITAVFIPRYTNKTIYGKFTN